MIASLTTRYDEDLTAMALQHGPRFRIPCQRFVVRTPSQCLAGVGAAYYALFPQSPSSLPVRLRLFTEECQSREATEQLVTQAFQLAAEVDIDKIHSADWHRMDASDGLHDDPFAPAWRALNAEHEHGATRYRTSLRRILDVVGPMRERAEGRGRLKGTTVIPLADVDPAPLVAMHQRYFGGSDEAVRSRLDASGIGEFQPRYSVVIIRDETPLGVILIRQGDTDTTMIGDSICVVPELRGGVADLLLMAESARRGHRDSIQHIEFSAGKAHASTHKFAERTGALRLAGNVRYHLEAHPRE